MNAGITGLARRVAAGQAGDAPAFESVMTRNRVPREGPGRSRTRPTEVLADRSYASRAIRRHLRRRGVRTVIPQLSDQFGRRVRGGSRGGRPPSADAQAYKQRNSVERFINHLGQWRGLATRTEEPALADQAALHLAGVLIWIRF